MEFKIYCVILINFAVIGGIGNFIALCFYAMKKTTIPHIFIRTLALTDFLTCTVTIPFTIWMEYKEFNISSDFLCKFYRFLTTSSIPFAAILMTPIAMDRFFSLCRPFSKGMSKKYAYLIIYATAVLSMIFGTIFAFDSEIDSLTNVTRSFSYDEQDVAGINDTQDEFTYNTPILLNNTRNASRSETWTTSTTLQGGCVIRSNLISDDFIQGFRYFYASVYAISVLVTLSIYIFIYAKVILWRKKRFQLFTIYSPNSANQIFSTTETAKKESSKNAHGPTLQSEQYDNMDMRRYRKRKIRKNDADKRMTSYPESFRSNIRLAIMLFSVSIVFILAYLPAWLMIFDIIGFNVAIFYMYFSYNVIHPITYVIMDRTFRKVAVKCICRSAKSASDTERSRYS